MPRLTYSPRALRAHLRRGGLVAYATRAVFGLGCDPFSALGLRRLLALKRRPGRKGLIVIADRAERLARLHVPLTPEQALKAHARWPGAHTWLIPASKRTPRKLTGLLHRGQKKGPAMGSDHFLAKMRSDHFPRIALRVDPHPDAIRLCQSLKMPLVSTSANLAGRRPLKTTRACLQQLGHRVWVVPGKVVRRSRPSTIADLLNDTLIRR
jgi:L-threonylcarbamoyladenylate synthase